jgi:hypothetical protein
MKRFWAIDDRLCRYALVERCQLALMRMSERQQVTVTHVRGIEEAHCIRVFTVKQRYIVGPKGVSGQMFERGEQLCHGRGGTGRIWISRMTDNTQHSIFCKWTSRPRLVPFCCKPSVCAVVLHMCRVDQSDQYVYVKKIASHGSSSRSRCTSSDVTLRPPLCTFRSRMPFRVLSFVSTGESARLANEEITSPTDFCSIAASSLAALSTSSSIASVVRIVLRHHASYIRCTKNAIRDSVVK